mmetsp:Transcript_23092/g.37992  ORF Transcript_23092/g.37992 Transcript_23092/m.37992 type:complete len:154 (+) Transcript_23092:128-589(+)|eukprot:CAMPEP_0184658214 /NCGR_PEP_ID=MMETSP0308-20130426/24262_1 /TAXON_ID=38269 /ORGANISM="Gloeochaete witrockiana, Strain SAG 46.84" /LENGTH=153 /DNA_ID=CAMNT_0027097003 /DNA_START=112 /DNA_END=573 /DNA_ORIENTATION=+
MTILFINKDLNVLVVKIKKRDRKLAQERDQVEPTTTQLQVPLSLIKGVVVRPAEARNKFAKLCKENVGELAVRKIGDTFYNIHSDPSKTILVSVGKGFEDISKLILQVEDENTPEEEADEILKCVDEYREKFEPNKVKKAGCWSIFGLCVGAS